MKIKIQMAALVLTTMFIGAVILSALDNGIYNGINIVDVMEIFSGG